MLRLLTFLIIFYHSCSCSKKSNKDAADQTPISPVDQCSTDVDPDQTQIAVSDYYIKADGSGSTTVTITLIDGCGNPAVDQVPQITLSGTGNTVTQSCPATNTDGQSVCVAPFTSLTAGVKVISLTAPVAAEGPQVEFLDPNRRGYIARGCGFDMNRNGIFGEEEDCRVCDGQTTDPDGDGVAEDLIYVKNVAPVGADTANCGAPASPCLTVQHALNIADGPGDGAEDIICVHGTFNEQLSLTVSGLATVNSGYYEAFDYQIPNNPTMIVGWDYDQDGVYPPFDTDDIADFNGAGTSERFVTAETQVVSYVEIAHLRVSDYMASATHGGLVRIADDDPYSGDFSHIYFHDIAAERINEAANNGVETTIVWFRNARVSHVVFENMSLLDFGGDYQIDFDYSGTNDRYADNIHFRYLSLRIKGQNGSDYQNTIGGGANADNVFFTGNVFDANLSGWTVGNELDGIKIYQCTRNWQMKQNTFIDFEQVLQTWGWNTCAWPHFKGIANIVFDGNIAKIGVADAASAAIDLYSPIAGGAPNLLEHSLKDFTITNNLIYGPAVTTCIRYVSGNNDSAQEGTLVIAGNTCVGFANNALLFPETYTNKTQNYRIFNNIFSGSGTYFVSLPHDPADFQSDNNLFNGTAVLNYAGGGPQTLAQWQTASGSQDLNSAEDCTVSFTDAPSGDYRIAADDLCALGKGRDISAQTGVDIRDFPRPISGDNIGAYSR